MDSMIHVGNQEKKDSVKAAAEAIDMVFASARTNTMDQSTVVEALQALTRVAEIKGIAISNCNFTSNPATAAEKLEDAAVLEDSPVKEFVDDDDDNDLD